MFWNSFRTVKFKIAFFYAVLFLFSLLASYTAIFLYQRHALYRGVERKLSFFAGKFEYEYLTGEAYPVGAVRLALKKLPDALRLLIHRHAAAGAEPVLALETNSGQLLVFMRESDGGITELMLTFPEPRVEKRRLSAVERRDFLEREFANESSGEGRNQFFFALLDPEGRALVQSDFDRRLLRVLAHHSSEVGTVGGDGVRHFGRRRDIPIYAESRKMFDGTTLVIGANITALQRNLTNLLTIFGISAGAMLLLGAGGGWWLAARFTGGIGRVTRAAREIRDGDFSQRVAHGGEGEELDSLVDAFNAMIENTEKLLNELKTVSDNLAHDLRTPLTRMRGLAELAAANGEAGELPGDVAEECESLLVMINTALEITRAECGVDAPERELVDLGKLARRVTELFAPVAEDAGLTLTLENGADGTECEFFAVKMQMQRMLGNLLDNAIKFTPAGGRIAVTVSGGATALTLTVADTGCGIAEADRKRVFERFYRADASRHVPGNGLGLCLVTAIVAAHGGQIALEDNQPAGTVVRIRFAR